MLKVILGITGYLSTQGITGLLEDHQILHLKSGRKALEYLLHRLKQSETQHMIMRGQSGLV